MAETHEPGVSVPMVAQRYNLNADQVFRWRRAFCDGQRKFHGLRVKGGIQGVELVGPTVRQSRYLRPSCPSGVKFAYLAVDSQARHDRGSRDARTPSTACANTARKPIRAIGRRCRPSAFRILACLPSPEVQARRA